jgi:hypothetical protein
VLKKYFFAHATRHAINSMKPEIFQNICNKMMRYCEKWTWRLILAADGEKAAGLWKQQETGRS